MTTTTSIILDLAVGTRLDITDAYEIAAAAADAGVSAVRVLAGAADEVLDPTAVAEYLADRIPELRWIVEAPTTHTTPYNLARRVLSLDRATEGGSGLALRAAGGGEVATTAVTNTAVTGRETGGRGRRWAEYARTLIGLWENSPEAGLLGDQVVGTLDGPSSAQGRPVLIADARDELEWEDVAALADVLVVSREQAPVAAWRFAAALERVGRRRAEVAVLGRADMTGSAFAPWTARELAEWAASHALDGLEVVIDGDRAEILMLLRALGPWQRPAPGSTLRDALGLPGPVKALA